MAALYSSAAVLLFPSFYEGFGLPVLEARLCGTPVVCSDAGSLPEAADGQAAIIAGDDIRGLSEAVLSALCAKRHLPPLIQRDTNVRERYHALYAGVAGELVSKE